jgi:hypothetical protein
MKRNMVRMWFMGVCEMRLPETISEIQMVRVGYSHILQHPKDPESY